MSNNKNWIQGVTSEMDRKGTTGSFTKQAKRHDMSVHNFAEKVKNNPKDYSKRTRERANLALTFEKIAKDRKGKYAHGGKTQGYNDRQNESLGMRRGAESSKKQDMRARREDSYGKWGKRNQERRKIFEKGGYNDKLDESLGMRTGTGETQSYKDRRDESKGANRHLGRRAYSSVGTMDTHDRINETRDDILQKGWQMGNGGTFAKGGTLSEKSVKKNYIRRDRYDKLKKEKDAKIDELKDANKDKISDLKKDLKDKGADCYDDIKQTKKDIGKTVAKRIDQVEKQKSEECEEDVKRRGNECRQSHDNRDSEVSKEKTESLILGGIGGLLLGMFFIK
jgi:hypothetical protein